MSNHAHSTPQNFSAEVRGQYEDFPYPFRDINEEGKYFHGCDPNTLMALSHYGWGGKRDLRHGVRILVAGCGTGDSTIHFAEELRGTDSEIVAIDLSSKSIEIATARMKKRGLDGVTFKHMSLLDLPSAGLGQFDIIESSGVLHHLPDPVAGLAALTAMLKPDGIMALMVYGQYGRLSVYLVQALMQKLMTEATPRAEKIAIARAFLDHVPMGHWLTVNNELLLGEINIVDGSGLYDLFLHSTDRAYTVPQLYEWVEGQGLQLSALFDTMTDESYYVPQQYNASPLLQQITAAKPLREQQAIAELMNGNMGKHYFYATKEAKIPAVFADDMVIDYGMMQHMFAELIAQVKAQLQSVVVGSHVTGPVRPFPYAPLLRLSKTRYTDALLARIDGQRSVATLVAEVAREQGGDAVEIRRDLEQLYHELRRRQMVYLRHESIPAYINAPQIIARLNAVLAK